MNISVMQREDAYASKLFHSSTEYWLGRLVLPSSLLAFFNPALKDALD